METERANWGRMLSQSTAADRAMAATAAAAEAAAEAEAETDAEHVELVFDVRVENHGSVFVFRPDTDGAKQWIRDNVAAEGWQWIGNGLAVDHGCAFAIAERMMADGLKVV